MQGLLSGNVLLRFALIQAVIFGGVGLVSLAAGWDYSMALAGAGAVIMVLRLFGGTPRVYNRHLGVETLERYSMRETRDLNTARRGRALMNDLFFIGIVPFVAGIALAFL
jgi:hypothetical protein